MKSNARKTYLDVLRVLANFLVIFNHTAGYTLYQYADSMPKSFVFITLSLFTKINIPLFFMITGALLLGKDEEIQVVFQKRILRFAILLISANTLMYFIRTPLLQFDFTRWLDACLNCSIEGSYWYLYAHMAFLIMLPYIRKIIANFSKKDFQYFMIVHFIIATCIPILDYVIFLANGKHVQLFHELQPPLMLSHYFFYPIIGYYIDTYVDLRNLKLRKQFALLVICIIGCIVTAYMTYGQGVRTGYTEDYFQMFNYFLAIAVFLLAKRFITNQTFISKITYVVAPLTLGIYILDPILKIYLPPIEQFLNPNLPTVLVAFIWCMVSMVVGGTITFLLRLLPGVKRVL